MKNKKLISTVFASMFLVLCFTASNSLAQTKNDNSKMKDCCMMKDGKMMLMIDGKTMRMEKDMTMKNGTKCMTNGDCIMKDGTKMHMKEGDCMDMRGKMDICSMMKKDMKSSTDKKTDNHTTGMSFTCPMHSDLSSDQPGKCSKCGMDLVDKK